MGLIETHLVPIIVFIFGLCFGSFLNVCIYRWPDERSVVRPRSFCPKCKHPIAWYDNIPIISYIILRGRCRRCGQGISALYPFVELFSGLLWLLAYMHYGLTYRSLVVVLFISLLLVSTIVDFQYRIIPDQASVGGMFLGIALSAVFPQMQNADTHLAGFLMSIFSALIGGGVLFLIALIGEWIYKKEAMGGGDVKLMAMIGAFLGWRSLLFVFFIGSITGAIFGIYCLIRYKDNTLPFGPFLSLGAVIYAIWGNTILQWLISYITI